MSPAQFYFTCLIAFTICAVMTAENSHRGGRVMIAVAWWGVTLIGAIVKWLL